MPDISNADFYFVEFTLDGGDERPDDPTLRAGLLWVNICIFLILIRAIILLYI